MKITVEERHGRVPVTVFLVEGEITADTAGPLLAETERAIRKGTHDVLLDLSAVPYIGSFGIRVLNDMLKLLNSGEGDQLQDDLRQILRSGHGKAKHLKLLSPTPPVKKVLEVSGLSMLLEMHEDEEKAVAAF